MRLLCFHGVGSSGSICEDQFGAFLKATDPSYEFVFVDGPTSSIRGPGMGAQFQGPFYSHTAGYEPKQMEEALDHLDAIVEDEGPFDGVVGFSQGAATVLSYIYDRQTRYGKPPFKFALLFSTVCAFSPDPQYARDVVEGLCSHGLDLKPADEKMASYMTSQELALHEAIVNVIKPLKDGQALLPDIDLSVYTKGDGSTTPRLLLPELMKEKIRIPTVHMHGKRDTDFMRAMSLTARGMFDEKLMRTLEHSGSHHPPLKDSEVKAVVRAMEWAIAQSRKMGIMC